MTTSHATEKRERLRAVVRGRVQGVNFRNYTQQRARRLGLLGWVRNLPDGAVEVLAEGPRAALDDLAALLQIGPPAARVQQVNADWSPAKGDVGPFEIRW